MSDWALTETFESAQGNVRWDAFGNGPPVVLAHGTPNWSWLWRKVTPRLAERHRVFVFDWPGFGLSDRFEGQNISWEEQPRRLIELIDHWGLEDPTVVAFDFAPIFALRARLLHGAGIGRLVLADAAVIPPFVTDFSRLARDFIGAFRQLPVYVAEAMIEAHVRSATHKPLSAPALEGFMRPWRGREGVDAYWRAVSQYDENMARPVAERLGELDLPTLVLWGENDRWLPPAMGRALAKAIPDAELRLVPEAGHFLPEDAPEAFTEAVRSFIAHSSALRAEGASTAVPMR